jgi:hypothetical protein
MEAEEGGTGAEVEVTDSGVEVEVTDSGVEVEVTDSAGEGLAAGVLAVMVLVHPGRV